jgi:hypothetical protein
MLVIFLSAGKQGFCRRQSRGHFPSIVSYLIFSEGCRASAVRVHVTMEVGSIGHLGPSDHLVDIDICTYTKGVQLASSLNNESLSIGLSILDS